MSSDLKKIVEQKNFCIIPWLHLYHFTDKKVYPCPVMGAWGVNKLGSIDDSIESLWNSEPLKKLRSKMIKNEDIPFCNKNCNDSINSCKRHFGLELLDKAAPYILSTKEDGTVDKPNFIAWNIIESNKCNFKCSYCNVKFSSRYGEKYSTFDTPEELMKVYGNYLDDVQEIWFASGESAIQPGYYKILNALIEKKRFDIRLFYITNMSTYSYQGQNMFELLNQFKHPVVFGSVDDKDERVEYIRFGSDYKKILDTRKKMQEYKNIKFILQPVMSIFNIFSFFDLHKDWYEKGLVGADQVRYYVLDSPRFLQFNTLPTLLKIKAARYLDEYKKWLSSVLPATVDFYPNRCHPLEYIDKMKSLLFANKQNNYLNELRDYIDTVLDKNSEKLKFNNIFPEYKNLL